MDEHRLTRRQLAGALLASLLMWVVIIAAVMWIT